MDIKEIKSCRVCNNNKIIEFLHLGNHPPANSLVKNIDEKEKIYPLSLSWCPNCNLVQLNQTVDPEKLFSNYVWVTSTSKTARTHALNFYNEVLKHSNDLKKGYILEVASNDGTFLKPFVNNKYKVLGVDPAKNIVEIANSNSIPTICRFFGVKTANEIIEKHGKASVVIARNVLPHVANLHDFVKGLEICIEDKGVIVIEFHYAGEILDELQYDSIYHEHLCYFTLTSIEHLLNSYDLYIEDAKKSIISGGSLILFIGKNSTIESNNVKKYKEMEKKKNINKLDNWINFAERVKKHRDHLLKILNKVIEKGDKIIGYGASARSSTLLNYCNIDSKYIKKIADQNNLKHNLYTAGTHISISSPTDVMSQKPDYVFILAWNFSDEIISILKNEFGYSGKCILPLPNNPRIVKCGGKR